MVCYDASSHMTEEIHNARKEAPRAIVMSVWIGAVTGIIFLIAACFCIGDIESTALSVTGVPLIQIFYDSTGSVAGATCLAVLIIVIDIGVANALCAEGGRTVYAFARDRVLVQIALNSIYFGSLTGFNTVVSIATEGFYLSYAIALFVRILSRFTGSDVEMSVDSENMNYTCAAVGVVMLIAAITWITTGRRQFTGPESGGVVLEGAPHGPEVQALGPDQAVNVKRDE
ncbi:hypothetical protein M8818_000716 [Zalaria obscura]|uniref:Uncharacterized protein n=1 Tax=Zalaria obscura TaxID=2024903 RepID=A0ACC3SMN5_9PEZI